MLIEFKVANYRSIRAEQTLSMVASNYSEELPQNLISCDHVPGLKGTKLVKTVALYGANASGKSNIVAALRFFAEFVRDSATKLQPGAPTGAQPFKLDPACLTEPSKFEITAVINGIRTLYGLEMTRERVTSEYLVAYPKGRPQVWFERDWDEGKGKYVWSKSTAHFKHDAALRGTTNENRAFLASLAVVEQKQAGRVSAWLLRRLWLMDLSRDGLLGRMMLEENSLRVFLGHFAKGADLGIAELRARQANTKDAVREVVRILTQNRTLMSEFAESEARGEVMSLGEGRGGEKEKQLTSAVKAMFTPEFHHRGREGAGVPLDFRDEESTGTQRFYELTADFHFAAAKGLLLVVDELEASLHPLLVRSLVQAFINFDSDGSNAQLLFTTHNPLLLDQTLLRRDQIWFTEKDQEGATRLYPLTDFKPRKDESLVKGYLAGRYGGIPFIPEGLKF